MNKQGIENVLELYKDELSELNEYVGACKHIDDDTAKEAGRLQIVISALTQQLNNGWIPVDESPEDKGWYLVTSEDGEIDLAHWYINEGWRRGHNSDVIAWQPLPEPYKEEPNEAE